MRTVCYDVFQFDELPVPEYLEVETLGHSGRPA